ncbi:MAG: capsule assembly Wzi family protein [Fibrobacteria bacterium]
MLAKKPMPPGRWLAALLAAVSIASAVPVDIANSVYGFLRRLELEGRITPGRLGTLPLPKSEVTALLREAGAREDAMPEWERKRLEDFREEFGLRESRDGRYHPLAYSDSSFRVAIHAESYNEGYIQDSLPRAMTHGFGSVSGTIEGSYKEKLQFLSNAGLGQERALHERFTENYDPARGLPYNTDRTGKAGIPRSASSFDAFRTVVGYEEPGFRLEFGSDWNQWGPGVWQHAFLSQRPWFWTQDSLPPSDSARFLGTANPGRYRRGYRYPGESAPMTQLRMAFRLGKFAYTKVAAQRTSLWNDTQAYVVAHRLEYRPWPFLGLGLQEMVATAGRPLDWTYIIPLVPLKFSEHELGDRDNSAVGMDAEVLLAGRGRIYGELLLDDFSGWDLDFWGAKYAYSLGAEAVGFPFSASRLQMEYAHVEPWVFTHGVPGDQMQHFGALLGSSLPANSHALRAAWEHALRFDLDVSLQYAFMQRDATSRGSSPFDVHVTLSDGTQKDFLGGTVETRNGIRLGCDWRWRRFVEFRGSAGYLAVSDWKSEAGESLSSPTFSGELILRY